VDLGRFGVAESAVFVVCAQCFDGAVSVCGEFFIGGWEAAHTGLDGIAKLGGESMTEGAVGRVCNVEAGSSIVLGSGGKEGTEVDRVLWEVIFEYF